MYGNQATDNGKVFDYNMAGQGCRIRHDNVIPYSTVMSYMAIGHEQVVAPYPCFSAAEGRPSVYGHKLSNLIRVTDNHIGFLAPELQVLGRSADGNELVYVIRFTDLCETFNRYMRTDLCTPANLNIFTDNAVWPYLHAIP